MTFSATPHPSALDPQQDGWCTKVNGAGHAKARYPDAAEASMALLESKENYLRRNVHGSCPIAYYECQFCRGWHLTSRPRLRTKFRGVPA